MVLSNKKLKQQLRIAKVESLSAGCDSNKKVPPEANPNSQLQALLEAASKQKSRLSKREKRKKDQSLQGLDGKRNNPGGGNSEEKKEVGDKEEREVKTGDGEIGDGKKKRKPRKRKREEGESEEEDGEKAGKAVKEEEKKARKAKKAKLKKKLQKKKKKTKGTTESQLNEDIVTKVYVGGIPYYSTEDDIRSFFEACGTITEVDCMTFPDTGKFRGIAIMTFKTDAAAKRALALDGADMGGLHLKIQPYKTRSSKVSDFAPKIVAGYNRVYVGNLSWDITEDDLRKFFSACKISSIRFGMDKDTGEFRGYAHVDFEDNVSLTTALKLDQQIVCGRPIKISCAVPLKSGKVQPTVVPASNETSNGEAIISSGNGESIISNANGESTISTGKIRRRTCYECGEKGHLSSSCPKKQTADPTTSNTS
ncbi:hypothetical protein Tsubulata_038735 [Turnera subulata]|uniref:Protein gar2 n=1 Tax=Turnera subulata TaxID=218843 RepID=A0A9Q0FNK1_9ROSI|nr:hypothetical protein Tsubulata_038735 [Turnera subulata]